MPRSDLHPSDPNYRPDRVKMVRLFCYNPATKRICGRTCKSWGQLCLCYLVVYSILTSISVGMFCVFYFGLLPSDVPRLIGIHNVLNGMPGVSKRPALDDPVYAASDKAVINKVKPHIKDLDDYLKVHMAKGGKHGIDCNSTTKLKEGEFCKLDMDELFPVGSMCTKAMSYGFTVGQPCIAVKINRIYGWVPELYSLKKLPKNFPKKRYDDKRVALDCYGSYATDRENIGTLKYLPEKGIPTKYFPYKGQKNYLDPFVWVQFLNATPTLDLRIKCKFFAKNIGYHFRVDISYVEFELLVDN